MHLGIQKVDQFLLGVVSQDRQYRSKDLLLHHRVVPGHIVHQCGGNALGTFLHITAEDDFIFIHQFYDTFKVLGIDNLSIVRIAKRMFAELADDFPFQMNDQILFHALLTVDIIRCHAGLSAV